MAWLVLLAFMVTSLISARTAHAVESPAELYWRIKLGNATVMPRIVKEGLMGSEEYGKSFVLRDRSKASIGKAQELLEYGGGDSRKFKFSGAQQATIHKDQELLEYGGGDSHNFKMTNQQKDSVHKSQELLEYGGGDSRSFKMTDQVKNSVRNGEAVWFYNHPKSFKVTSQQEATIHKDQELLEYGGGDSHKFKMTDQQKDILKRNQELLEYGGGDSHNFKLTDQEKNNLHKNQELLEYGGGDSHNFKLTDQQKENLHKNQELLEYGGGDSHNFKLTDQQKENLHKNQELLEYGGGDSHNFKLTDHQKENLHKNQELLEYGGGDNSHNFKLTDQQKQNLTKHQVNEGTNSHGAKVDPANHAIFLTQKDLTHPGKSLKLNFLKSDDGIKFLPTQVAKSIPFTSTKLPTILRIFNVDPKSDEAEIMEQSLRGCENTLEGEDKYCATTFEGLVDYVTTHVGNNVTALSTYVDKDIKSEQRIQSVKKVGNNSNLVCHKMGYPYAVFYCHNIKNTDMYDVSLVGTDDGKKMNVVCVCHRNTSSWSPTHISFRILNVKPGSPVCHLLDERSVAWVPNN